MKPKILRDIGDLIINKINKTDIINNLTTATTGKVLDASQGKILKDNIDTLSGQVSGLDTKLAGKANTTIATTTANGLMASVDKTKLNGIAANANNYVHPGSGTNPHGTTKADIGLGSVQNYGIATQAQVDTGTANNLYVTPLGLKGLKNSITSGKNAIASAITAKGVAASGNDSHATLANKIGQINSTSDAVQTWLNIQKAYLDSATFNPLYITGKRSTKIEIRKALPNFSFSMPSGGLFFIPPSVDDIISSVKGYESARYANRYRVCKMAPGSTLSLTHDGGDVSYYGDAYYVDGNTIKSQIV